MYHPKSLSNLSVTFIFTTRLNAYRFTHCVFLGKGRKQLGAHEMCSPKYFVNLTDRNVKFINFTKPTSKVLWIFVCFVEFYVHSLLAIKMFIFKLTASGIFLFSNGTIFSIEYACEIPCIIYNYLDRNKYTAIILG